MFALPATTDDVGTVIVLPPEIDNELLVILKVGFGTPTVKLLTPVVTVAIPAGIIVCVTCTGIVAGDQVVDAPTYCNT